MEADIYLHDFYALIVSNSLNVLKHKHPAHQFTFSLSHSELDLSQGGNSSKGKYFYIPAMTEHYFSNEGQANLTILVDQEGQDFELKNLKKAFEILEKNNFMITPELQSNILRELKLDKEANLSEKIKRVISTIDEAQELENLRATDLSQLVNLSESRFLHLFKEEVGIPLRKFILWRKLKRAMTKLKETKDFSSAAHYAGFSDQAHFSRFFKESFGLNMSDLMKDSRFIQ